MNKKKTVVLSLLLVVIVMLTSCLLYACDPANAPEEPEELEPTEGLLIQNGDFKMVNDVATSYPRSLNNWSGSKMYSSSSFRDDVIAGAISLDGDLYGANKKAWDDENEELKSKLTTGGHGDDNDEIKNVLMIYQPKLSKDADDKDQHGPTAYGYTSASFTLSKGSYYRLSVDVLTYDIAGVLDEEGKQVNGSEPGARIYVSSNTYAEFAGIDTKGEWKTYTIYIETSPTSSTSLTVQLGLGKYTASYSDGLTSGYVFFDNLSLKRLVKEADNEDIKDDDVANLKVADPQAEFTKALTAEKKFDAAEDKTSVDAVATTTLKVPNGRFDFGSYNLSSSGVPNSWTHVTGNSGKENPAPTGLGYNAIVDTSKFAENYTKYSSSYRTKTGAGDTDSSLYTPANILSGLLEGNNKINDYTGRVGKNVFMLSQQLMTAQGIRSSRTITIEKGKDYALTISMYAAFIRGAGVSLILSGADGKDIVIEGIAQNKSDSVFLGSRVFTDVANGYTEDNDTSGTATGWKDYTFYIHGNDYKDYSYNLTIWLGTDGTESNHAVTYHNFSQNSDSTTYDANGTFSTGWVFIDELTLKEGFTIPSEENNTIKKVDENNKLNVSEQIDQDVFGETNFVGAIVDLADQNKNQIKKFLDPANKATNEAVQSVGEGAPKDWTSHYELNDNAPYINDYVKEGVVDISDKNTFTSEIGTYPGLPYDMPVKKAYAMYASQDSYYEVETAPITIDANRFYRVSFWLKTVDVKDTSGAYVYVLNKTAQAENKEKNGKDDEVILTSITRINTDDYDEYLNDWVEINLVFRGAVKEDTKIAIKFTLGTGTRFTTTTLTSGALYVANFNMADLTYANYTGTSSSTYTKTCDLSTAYSYQFTNGSFDNYDLDDENLNADINHLYDQDVPATPESWDISDETIEKNKTDKNLYAGIIQLNEDEPKADETIPENFFFSSSHQAETATGIGAEFFNSFYGDKANTESYYSENNMKAIAGPNVLAIGSKSSEKFAIGFTSKSFTLSANSYNVLSVYAKTYGDTKATIRLTGEASSSGNNKEANHFEVTSNDGWTKYTFFIKVGKNSVSLKLNLWLGDDIQYIADKDDPDYDKKAEEVKSAGHVFFDNISSYTLDDEDKYDEALQQEKDAGYTHINELDFNVESFDPLSGSVESRRTLTSPGGWTGSAGTNQSSANTKSGIIYTGNDNYFERNEIEGEDTQYAKLLGKEYSEDDSDITVSVDELNEYRANHNGMVGVSNYDVRKLIVAEKVKELKRNNWIPVGQLTGENGAIDGEYMLVINNTTKSAYTYTSSSNTLKGGNKVYKISIWMRTYGLNNAANDDDFKDATTEEQAEALRKEKEIGAYMELYLGSANETGNEFAFKAVASSEWTEYCFYVQTQEDDVTSVTIKLSLGKYINKDVDGKSVTNGLTTGYAMFDMISIDEITENGEDKFTEVQNKLDPESSAYDKEFAKTNLARKVAASESGTPSEPDTNTETPKSSFNLEYLWWMIPTIVLGLVIIIVLVVFVIRKVRKATPNKPAKIKKSPASPSTAQTLDEKHDRYDQDKD